MVAKNTQEEMAKTYVPPEIVSKIMGSVLKNDLKRLRLVSTTFNALATPFLFDEVSLTTRSAGKFPSPSTYS